MKVLNFSGILFLMFFLFSCSTNSEGDKTSPVVDGTVSVRSGQSCDPGVPSGYLLINATPGQDPCCITLRCKYPAMVGGCYRYRSGTVNSGYTSIPGYIPALEFEICDYFDGPDILIETVSCSGGSGVITCDVFDNPCN